MNALNTEELKRKAICSSCIGEGYLRNQVQKNGRLHKCKYCEEKKKSFKLEEIANIIEQVFEVHFSRTAQNPDSLEEMMMRDPEGTYDWERQGDATADAIMNAADISEEAAHDIQTILSERHEDFDLATMGEEAPFSEDAHYEEIMPEGNEWQEGWYNFEASIKTEARFFSRTGASQLAALFDDIETMRTHEDESLIMTVGPGTKLTHLFRARVFQSDRGLKKALARPDLELAAPPSNLASSGRMNAKGISTFYGATDPNIALAEVRPPVGSHVLIAQFEIIKPLQLLDLNRLSSIRETGSIFDPSYARRLGRMTFLKTFCQRVSRPVMPDDQDSEYITTQAVADYLATECKVPLDGILFPSVQAGGKGLNAVLFHKASKCEEMDIPEGTEIEASTGSFYEDGWEQEYTVIERVPAEKKPSPFDPFEVIDLDDRKPTLKIIPNSLSVHNIESVKFKTTEESVKRRRWNKQDDVF